MNKESTSILKQAEDIYNTKGASEVYDFANKQGLEYRACTPCEAQTPSVEGICVVCGHSNGVEIENLITFEILYRDGANYKTRFNHTVDLTKYPAARLLKVEDTIEMGQFGTLSEKKFFNSTIHTHGYDFDHDHNLLEIEGIVPGRRKRE